MKRLTFTSALLEARRLEADGIPTDCQSHRGDEGLCASCARWPGKIYGPDGRLFCRACARKAVHGGG